MTNDEHAEYLWGLAWPDVPWDEASLSDRTMYLAHAQSLTEYNQWRGIEP